MGLPDQLVKNLLVRETGEDPQIWKRSYPLQCENRESQGTEDWQSMGSENDKT